MTAIHINLLRAKVCQIVSCAGAVLDELTVIEESLSAPSNDRTMDHAVIATRTGNAAETASHLAIVAQEFSETLDKHCERLGKKGGAK